MIETGAIIDTVAVLGCLLFWTVVLIKWFRPTVTIVLCLALFGSVIIGLSWAWAGVEWLWWVGESTLESLKT